MYTKEQEDLIVEMYINQKRGQLYTANKVGTTIPLLKKWLIKHNYHIRNRNEATILLNKNRAKRKNDNYFDKQSHNMAWLLGFIASDGCIAARDNEIAIGLSIVDIEILEKIKKELDIENKITIRTTNGGFKTCKISWSCAKHKQVLADYGIVPNKTFNLRLPTKLKKEYIIDYIRGYFDGDGSVSYIKANSSLRWQICSASKEILEFFINFLYEEYNIPKVKIYTDNNKRKHTLYYFQYNTNATKKIYNILYIKDSLFLKRKKDKFDKLILLKE